MQNTAYLYVYDGPNGPISHRFEADSWKSAWAHAQASRREWFNDKENYLDLEPGAAVPSESLVGWRLVHVEAEGSIYVEDINS